MNNLIPINELAERFRIAPITIRRMIRNNEIPFHRIGKRKIFFTDDDIQMGMFLQIKEKS